jgi:PAS domain S-box-containing protein
MQEREAQIPEEEFRLLADNMPVMCWIADATGYIHWYNRRWFEYTGTTAAQMKGWGWQSVHDPRTLDAVLERWKTSLATGEPFEMVFPLRSAAGEYRPFLTRVQPHFDTQGRLRYWFGNNVDITAQKAAEQGLNDLNSDLRKAVAFNEAALKCLGEGLYTIDENGLVTSMNPAAEELFGWSFAELRGKKMHEMAHHHYRDGRPFPACECAGFQVLTNGQPLKNHEDVFIRKDGTFFDVIYTVAPLRDDGGKITGLVVVFSDVTERKRTEDQLRRVAAFDEAALKCLGEGLYTLDLNGLLTSMNPAAEELFGWSFAELRGKKMHDVVHHLHRDGRPFPACECAVLQVLSDGQPLKNQEDVFIRKDGAFFDVIHSIAPLRDEDGKVAGLVVVFKDITERKRAQEALRESEERFGGIVTSAMDAIIALDNGQNIILFNAAAEALFGCKAEEAVGAPIDRFIPERFRAAHQAHIQSFGMSGQTTRAMGHLGLVSGLRSGGEEFPIEASISQLEAGGRRVFTVILRDITERKRAEMALRESEDRLRVATEAAKIGAFDWKVETGVNTWNPELEAIHGLQPGEFGGSQRAWEQLVHPDDRAGAVAKVEEALLTGQAVEHEWRVIWPDGSVHWIAARFQGFKDTANKPVRLIGVNIDITKRKQAELALAESDRRKDEFIAMLAHELRNPLAPIRNGLQVLRKSGGQGPAAERMQLIMERQVGHLVRLVDDLLEVSRISRGRIELKRERVALSTAIDHAVEVSREAIDAAGTELRVVSPDQAFELDADPVRLTQIFGNLLSNAAKYTDRGGHVEIAVTREGDEAVVSVTDSGVGIPKEMLPRVFDLFAQFDRTLSRAQGGLGIGLALVKSLVGLHGGKVEAQSGGEGCGSRFIVRLPLSKATKPDEPVRESAPPTAAPSLRVLVVDDEIDVADAFAALLATMGAMVRVAYGGAEGLKACVELEPDLVFLDIGMPHMDGFETARRLRKLPVGREATLVALTGWGEEETRRRARDAGFDRHLTKPANIRELEALLVEVACENASKEKPLQ